MNGAGMTVFVAGFIAGGAVFWNVSLALERFRRARHDFQATRRGLRTLVEMMFRRGWQAIQGLLLAAAVIGIVFLIWRHHDFK